MIGFIKVCLCVLLLNACQASQKVESTDSIASIDLENRDSFTLPLELNEISGHVFLPTNDEVLYCIQDEKGIVYAFNLKTQKIEREIVFGPDGDYEGITTDGSNFYVLKSNGHIYSFPVKDNLDLSEVKIFKQLVDKGEYESLGIDTVNKQLAVLCKSCKIDRKESQSTGYLLSYTKDGDVALSSSFNINLNLAREVYSKFPKVFEPSAITKKYSTNEWYILSSIDKMILITDSTFKPLSVVPFARKNYEQPEGIAFDSKENLYISSEIGAEAAAMLYKIK